jgi:chaperone required for assembly of F1-ATPase
MTGWVRKRFWRETTVEQAEGGFTICLDARQIRTPAGRALVVPTQTFARIVAAEWAAQDGEINPETMPATRSANLAIDKIGDQFEPVVDTITAYGGSDLLCYRATAPQALIDRQRLAWDPLLEWVSRRFDAPLRVTQGVMPVPQPPESLLRLRAAVASQGLFEICALHDLVALSGSLVVGLAVAEGVESAETLWALSRIDEDWQAEQWGEDEEARATAEWRRAGFVHAARLLQACK